MSATGLLHRTSLKREFLFLRYFFGPRHFSNVEKKITIYILHLIKDVDKTLIANLREKKVFNKTQYFIVVTVGHKSF